MDSVPTDVALEQVLTESQRLGFLGDRPISEVIEHARKFVEPLEGVVGTVIDIGSGGGVPGLVIAHDRPDLYVVLVDRRAKRTDFLRRVVSRLEWTHRVRVITDDVERIIGSDPQSADVVVARGFGPPVSTLRMGSSLIRPGGLVVISEPPAGDRWDEDVLVELGLCRIDHRSSAVAVFSHDVSRGTSMDVPDS